MDGRIKRMLEQGRSRDDIFEQLQVEARSEIRLANKVATCRLRRPTGLPWVLNWVLWGLVLAKAGYGAWVIHISLAPRDEIVARVGIGVVLVLTALFLVNLVRSSFYAYFSFLMLCGLAAVYYLYTYEAAPLISVIGLALSLVAGALAYYLKIRLFPHMGMLDVRRDGRGRYILD